MRKPLVWFAMASVALLTSALALAQSEAQRLQNRPWDNPGWRALPPSKGGPAPRRDLSGIWDAGAAGISAGLTALGLKEDGSGYTALGQKMVDANKPTQGPRRVDAFDSNDPLYFGDPGGFPRLILYELRPVQIVHTSDRVMMFYLWEKRWRVIWTDSRALPDDPDPRWYGYSVGRWEDDQTFVVDTVGMDERTWVTNGGDPHTAGLRVEERYHRVNQDTIELTVTVHDPAVYVRPWKGRNRIPLRRMLDSTDVMEMMNPVTEFRAYEREFLNQAQPK